MPWALHYGLGKKFDAPTRAAWTHVYQLLALTMKMGKLSVAGAAAKADSALSRVIASPGSTSTNGSEGAKEVR